MGTPFVCSDTRPAARTALYLVSCISKQTDHPIHNAIHRPRQRAVQQHGAGYGEDLGTHTQDESLALPVDGGRYHGVGEARDGHQRSRSREFGDAVKDTETREDGGDEDEGAGGEGARVGLLQAADLRVEGVQPLAEGADQPAREEGAEAVFQNGGLGGAGVGVFLVGFFG